MTSVHMRPRRWGVALASGAVALSLATAAQAIQVVSDNFDSENGGATATNYTGFANFDVVFGSVDLIAGGEFDIDCVGGACVDLDGSTFEVGQLGTDFFAFDIGDIVTLSFDLSGAQRGLTTLEDFHAGFEFDDNTAYADLRTGGAYGNNNFGGGVAVGLGLSTSTNSAGFLSYTLSFRALESGLVRGLIGAGDGDAGDPGDNFGPILDNVGLDISPAAVPEPSTWALMILGFGGAGAVLRRRRAIYA